MLNMQYEGKMQQTQTDQQIYMKRINKMRRMNKSEVLKSILESRLGEELTNCNVSYVA